MTEACTWSSGGSTYQVSVPAPTTTAEGPVPVMVWSVGGVQYKAFDAAAHPRDRNGKFIRIGAHVRIWGGGGGTVVSDAGSGMFDIRRDSDGKAERVHRNYLTVDTVHAAERYTEANTNGEPGVAHTRFGDLAVGDRIIIGDPGQERVAEVTQTDEVDGDHTANLRYPDGTTEVVIADPSELVPVVTGRAPAPPPAVLPDDSAEPFGRPALYTYQRRMIGSYNLEDTHPDPVVRRAAARVRNREPISHSDTAALAGVLRDLVDRPGTNPRRAAALKRVAGQFDTLDAHLTATRGATPGTTPARGVVTGNRVRIGDSTGRPPIEGKVTGVQQRMGGRITALTITDDAGETHERVLMRGTPVTVVASDAGPTPVPDPDAAEPTGPVQRAFSDIVGGDTVTLPAGNDGPEITGTVVRSTHITGAVAIRVQTADGSTVARVRPPGAEVWVHPTLPAPEPVIDPTPPAPAGVEWPKEVGHAGIKVGDRVRIANPGTGEDYIGTVHTLDPVEGENEDGSPVPGVALGVALDGDVTYTSIHLYGDDTATVLDRPRDGQTVVDAQRRHLEERRVVEGFRKHLDRLWANVQAEVATEADYAVRAPTEPDSTVRDRALVNLARARGILLTSARRQNAGAAAQTIATSLHGPNTESRRAATSRVLDLLDELAASAYDQAVESIRNSTPRDGETMREAVKRTAEMVRNSPPSAGNSAVAAGLARLREKIRADVPEHTDHAADAGDIPDLGTGTPGERIAKARAVLPARPGDFGKRHMRIRTFAEMSIADLREGKTPEIITEDRFIDDVALDGGPGHTALRHLEAVRAIGAVIQEDTRTRMSDTVPELKGRTLADYEAEAAKKIASGEAAAGAARTRKREAHAKVLQALPGEGAFVSIDSFRRRYRQLVDDAGVSDPRTVAAKEKLDVAERVWAEAGGETARADLDRELAAVHQIRMRQAEVRAEHATARSRATLAALSGVRKMGRDESTGAALKFKQKRGEAVQAVEWAQQFYPTDWLSHAGKDELTVGIVQRGYYDHSTKRVRLSRQGSEVVAGAGQLGRVAVHELGHRMEVMVPGLLVAESTFLWHRTTDTGTEVGSRTRTGSNRPTSIYGDVKEVGRKDEFSEHYTGKEYGGRAFEVFTTGIESVFAGSPYLDDDFEQFMLGVLAAL